jgi:long-chain acyl-CoA synthetase
VLIAEGGEHVLQSVVDGANRELPPFQQIRSWLRWPQPEFPRTSTGKVLRRQVQSWAQASLAGGGVAVADPSDRLLEVLRRLGAAKQEIAAHDRLAEDLQLDSLAMVQLQSTLETEFGLELEDTVWGEVRTVGDLRRLLAQPANAASEVSGGVEGPKPVTAAATVAAPARLPAMPSKKEGAVFPRWPWWPAVYWVRAAFLEGVMRPCLWLVLGPRIAPRVPLARPSLLIANHLTAFDVPVILYALTSNDREHMAVAMSGELLSGWRWGKAERHPLASVFTPLA